MNTMDELKQEAKDFIYRLVEGDFAGACRRFDNDMAQALPEARLKETWLQLIGQAGAFQEIGSSQAVEKQGHRIVTVTCRFEKAPMDVYVVFNPSGHIAGLNVMPTPTTSPYEPPAYVDTGAFHEVDVTVGSGEWALPGTLSMPSGGGAFPAEGAGAFPAEGAGAFPAEGAGAFPAEGAGAFPAVVLVHGSGPQDRDETIGPNRPFRDLAWGLASQGIAVLRYDKRTKAHADQITSELRATWTVQEEVIDDALAAVRLLRRTPGIDPGRIYVLGHSLGATMAPRIGQQDPSIAGLIVMAGLTRPLEDTILDQYTHIYSLSEAMTDEQKAELEELKAKVARVKDPGLSGEVPAKDLPLNIPPAYWLDLRGYRPAEVAKSLDMPMLVLQGGRDYQVTVQGDFPGWQEALADKRNATLKLYPNLFHLFMEGEGPARPEDYLVEAHVSGQVIQDIARWIEHR
jgi:dienelactone hydrolase